MSSNEHRVVMSSGAPQALMALEHKGQLGKRILAVLDWLMPVPRSRKQLKQYQLDR